MNQLSKEKRNHLILVALLTLMAIVALWLVVISPQRDKLAELSRVIQGTEEQLRRMKLAVNQADKIETELKVASAELTAIEGNMAPSNDPYLWIIDLMNNFKRNYDVDIPNYSNPTTGDTTLLPEFPYKQAKIPLAGKARFFHLGKFLADLENQFPYSRVENLYLESSVMPPGGESDSDGETLSFRMEIVMLIRTGAS
jgi:hypothetical protein